MLQTPSEFAMRRSFGPSPSYTQVLNYKHPNNNFVVISGPCSVESKEQIETIAKHVSINGATHLRGGVFRAGTYPGENFGWIDLDLIKAYQDSAHRWGLKNIIEILDYSNSSLETYLGYADCFQVGCRQMQNYKLLRLIASYKKPVFLKRHPGSKLDEFLGAAEHLLVGGCKELYLIERGSVSHVNHVRWDLSISMIPAIKEITNIPILVDASHGTGRRDLVEPMTLAGVAAGADGCLIETHPFPSSSLSDADQALGFKEYEQLMRKIRLIKKALEV